MASATALVRGTTVDAARRYVERHRSSPAWPRFLEELPEEPRRLLEEPVRRSHWYHLQTYAGALEVAVRCLAPEEPERFLSDLGRFVLDDGVNTLYRAFFAIASPSFVIRGSALLWGLFFKGSRLRVLHHERHRVTVAITGSSFCSVPLCISIGGGMLSSLEHAGARAAHLQQHRCISQGHPQCEFHFAWA
jgi:hypothetical protein